MNREARQFIVVGAGGLGCPALLGLAAGGARRITVVDPDTVEVSNLQRQVLFDTTVVGMSKATAAARWLQRRYPDLEVTPRDGRVDAAAADAFVEALAPDSIVLDCTDNPAVKFALNDACLRLETPLVIGAALRWSGQAIAILGGYACYRCIYEEPPPQDLLPNCDQAGVVGSAVGQVGALMAALAWALARGQTETAGRLTTIDLQSAIVRTLAPRPRVSCPACRAHQPAADLDYEASAAH